MQTGSSSRKVLFSIFNTRALSHVARRNMLSRIFRAALKACVCHLVINIPPHTRGNLEMRRIFGHLRLISPRSKLPPNVGVPCQRKKIPTQIDPVWNVNAKPAITFSLEVATPSYSDRPGEVKQNRPTHIGCRYFYTLEPLLRILSNRGV